jgi:N-acyl homoserine lactone hydrolase
LRLTRTRTLTKSQQDNIDEGPGLEITPSSTQACSRPRHAVFFVIVLAVTLVMSIVARNAVDAAPLAKAQRRVAPPKTLRLYVFDCGKLAFPDPSGYGFTKNDLITSDMSVPCFLISHPNGTLMWDVGVLPDRVFKSSDSVTQGRATVTKPLKAQLAEIGYTAADITYLALSHYHLDHTANANDFAGSTWIVQKPDRDVMFSDPPPNTPNITPGSYNALRTSKTVILTSVDHDVFGDGTVIIKFAPGHTPGHQVLFLKLRKTGPIVLSGDLYHYPEERAQHRIPKTELDPQQTAATRAAIDVFLKETGAQLWIQHDFTANAKLKKSPAYYE